MVGCALCGRNTGADKEGGDAGCRSMQESTSKKMSRKYSKKLKGDVLTLLRK
jgi:hypothetical protein